MRAGRWLRIAACGVFMLCLALARSASLELEGLSLDGLRGLSLSFPLSGQDAANMLEKEQGEEHPAAFALWGEDAGAFAVNEALSRSASCSLITIWGDPDLLYPSDPLLSDDPDGCLVSRAAAMELFGSYSPAGGILSVSGRSFTVRGLAETGQPLVIVPASARDSLLDHLTVRLPEGDPPSLAIDSFSQRHGLYGQLSYPGMWASLARAASMLPVAVLMLGAVLGQLRAAFAPGAGRVRFWAGIALAGALWFLLLWLTEFRFALPEDWIPNKWSDFDFWSRLLAGKKDELLQGLARGKSTPELALMLPAIRAGVFGAAAALIAPLLPKPSSPAGLWIVCAAGAVMAFAAAVLLDPALAHDKVVWLALPVGMAGRWYQE